MRWTAIACFFYVISTVSASTILGPGIRKVPGADRAEHQLLYADPVATTVEVSGAWDAWEEPLPMIRRNDGGPWSLDIRSLGLSRGRYEFKFIMNGAWEGGSNRTLYVDPEGAMRQPPDLLRAVNLEAPDRIEVVLKGAVSPRDAIRLRLEPPAVIVRVDPPLHHIESGLTGYLIEESRVRFVFDPDTYGQQLKPATDTVSIGANFNGWAPGGAAGRWQLKPAQDGKTWFLTTPLSDLHPPADEPDLQFKFVLNGEHWLGVPQQAPNAVSDGRGNVNLQLDPSGGGSSLLRVHLAEPLPLDGAYTLIVDGLTDRQAWMTVSPGPGLMATWTTTKPLGAILDRKNDATHYRLFAPRATYVDLCFFDGPDNRAGPKRNRMIEPVVRRRMQKAPDDGVWEFSAQGLDIGRYYSFQLDGPHGDGEGFAPDQPVGDPYARAAAEAGRNTMVIDPQATNRWFAGWTDQAWETPDLEDLVIYEAHVRDLTSHVSSGVPVELRGTFAGIPASLGTGTGLDHLRELGVNALELLPIAEFSNADGQHDWGYASTFFFAPESSYGRSPTTGSQYYEFKQMVDDLHQAGFAVILDVVFNHAGYPNILERIDRKYFFRLNPDLSYSNFSGVGNDCRSESPMMRRLILDNVLYWMREHHVDGFRFDLAELIDMETLSQLESEARALNPKVILISEPWSFRGNHKNLLTGTGWAAWNDDFRNAVKGFMRGSGDRGILQKVLSGSTDLWTAHPLQSVNYLESHDDMSLADEMSTVPGRDATTLLPRDVQSNLLGATLLFTSLGIKMIAEGQAYLRSKQGIHNTYNRGDEINALYWDQRDRPLARGALTYYQDLIRLMRSPAGQSFRIGQDVPADYYHWILPREAQALGYVINVPHRHPGAGFAVLANASDRPVPFPFVVPDGNWRLIGDGQRVLIDGIPDHEKSYVGGTRTEITVPGKTAYILRNGF